MSDVRRTLSPDESASRWDDYSLRPLREGHPLEHLADVWRYRLPLYWTIQKHLPAGGRVLEVGTGNGAHVMWLAARGYEATGVDFRPAVVDAASDLASRFEVQARFAEADAFSLNAYRDFDVVFSVGMIEHWDRDRTVAALREQAACGRTVIAEIPTRHTRHTGEITDERFYSRSQLGALFADAGLSGIQVTAYGDIPTRLGRLVRLGFPPVLLQAIQRRTGRLAMSLVGIGHSQ